MSEPLSKRADREAQRSLVVEALGDLSGAADPHRAATDAMRAIDAYFESAPVAGDARREILEARSITWIVVVCTLLATIAVSVLLSGWIEGLAIGVMGTAALFVLLSS